MTAEDFFVHDGCHREAIETIGEGLPKLDVVSSLTYSIKDKLV